MPRLQFTLRALLVAMLVAAAFFGGMVLQRSLDKPLFIKSRRKMGIGTLSHIKGQEVLELSDGTTWYRDYEGPPY